MKDDLLFRLRKRAEIRRQIPSRKSVQNNEPDRIADLLEEAADALEELFTEQLDVALDDLVDEMNKETLDRAQNQIDTLRLEVKRLQQICESHIRSEYEGTSLLDGMLAEVYGNDINTQR